MTRNPAPARLLAIVLLAGTSVLFAQNSEPPQPSAPAVEAESQEPAASDEEETPAPRDVMSLVIDVPADTGYWAETSASATRLSVPLDEVPVNVQVVTKEVLEDFQLTSQRDALQFHAAVDDKRVRGFDTSEFFRNGFIHLSDVPGYTIQRMEIIRGATAVLNGPVTPGGAVNMITKQANPGNTAIRIGSYWGVSGDDRDNRGVNVDLNLGSLGPQRDWGSMAALRLVGGFQDDTGFATRVDNESIGALASLRVQPFQNTHVALEYYQYEINTDRTDRPMAIELTIPGSQPGTEIPLALAYGVDPRSTWFGSTTDIEESLNDYALHFTQFFSERFFADFRFNRHERDFVFGPGNRPRIDIFYPLILRSGAPAGSSNPADYQIRRLTENLDLINDIDQISTIFSFLPGWGGGQLDHRFVVGFDTYDQDQDLKIARPRAANQTSGFFFEFFDPAQVDSDNLDFNRNNVALNFITVVNRARVIEQRNAFVNYHGTLLSGRLHVLLGLYNSDITIIDTNLLAAVPSPNTVADSDELLPQAGFVYAVNGRLGLYVNYSESQLPDLNNPDFSVAPPVRLGEQWEVGTKLNLFGGKVDGNIGAFWIDEELFGETTRSAEAQGFEIDASIRPTPNVNMVLSYAYADTKVTASSNASQIGDPLVDEIPHKAALWARYELPRLAQGFSVGGAVVWTGERVRPTAAASQIAKKLNGRVLRYEPETRVDLFANYHLPTRSGTYELALNLRNLTREANISNTVPRVPLQGGVRADGSPYVFDGDREIMLGVTFTR